MKRDMNMNDWIALCHIDDIPSAGARRLEHDGRRIALFRGADDRVFALVDRCPHKGGPLSQGMVCGHKVTCPLHGWSVELDSGMAVAPDHGQATTLPIKVEEGRVYLGPS